MARPKGYFTASGFMGFVEDANGNGSGTYILFATESDYYEYIELEDDLNV